MGRERKNEAREEQFAKWVRAQCALPSWKALSFPAREAYHHLKIRCLGDTAQKNRKVTNNNGSIFRSPRVLAEDMGCSAKTAMAALADLQAKGWIICTVPPELGMSGKGKTAHFRLTMMPTGEGRGFQPATREAERWREGRDFPVLAYAKYLPKPRTNRIGNIDKSKTPHPNGAQGCIRIGRRKPDLTVVTASE